MFRTVKDFEKSFKYESDSTLKILRALTDASLQQRVAPEGRTLGRLAWHLVQSQTDMLNKAGLAVEGPDWEAPVPTTAALIVSAYEHTSQSVLSEITKKWNDAALLEEHDLYRRIVGQRVHAGGHAAARSASPRADDRPDAPGRPRRPRHLRPRRARNGRPSACPPWNRRARGTGRLHGRICYDRRLEMSTIIPLTPHPTSISPIRPARVPKPDWLKVRAPGSEKYLAAQEADARPGPSHRL